MYFFCTTTGYSFCGLCKGCIGQLGNQTKNTNQDQRIVVADWAVSKASFKTGNLSYSRNYLKVSVDLMLKNHQSYSLLISCLPDGWLYSKQLGTDLVEPADLPSDIIAGSWEGLGNERVRPNNNGACSINPHTNPEQTLGGKEARSSWTKFNLVQPTQSLSSQK